MMKKMILTWLLLAALLLSGCSSFLNREYSTRRTHSSNYYENGQESVLRAENYQDIVNDLLVLVGNSAHSGTIWVYESDKLPDAAEAAEKACREVQRETPLGAYAVDYLSYTIDDTPRNYTALQMTLGYRRTPEQISGIVHATNLSALSDLLTAAVSSGAPELVVQLSYFDEKESDVRQIVDRVQAKLQPEEKTPWPIHFYPEKGDVGIIEIILKK